MLCFSIEKSHAVGRVFYMRIEFFLHCERTYAGR